MGTQPVVGVQNGWKELSLLNATEARAAFAAVPPAGPAAREARLGAAVSLFSLHHPPFLQRGPHA